MMVLELKKEILEHGKRLSHSEMIDLLSSTSTEDLCRLAGELRDHFTGSDFDTCSIINARSGKCPEDCKWCSQSKFHKTKADIYPLISAETALEAARHNADRGVRRFSLVTSGRKVSLAEMPKVKQILDTLRENVDIELCASLGLLDGEEMKVLWESGVKRYHCNLETAPSYFKTLCTTHTIEDKIETIRHAQKLGMDICSGGIIGMGESMEQRVELAITLREIGVGSIPVNVLNPIEGTPLAVSEPLTKDEILRSFAMFRIVNPEARIRFAGGRKLIGDVQVDALKGGVDSAIVGDMLTTIGSAIDEDMKLFHSLGYKTKS